jgi:hypothetical protein
MESPEGIVYFEFVFRAKFSNNLFLKNVFNGIKIHGN